MSWLAVGLTVGTAGIGAVQANEQQQAQKKQNLAAAENNRYAHITGNTMQQRFDAPSTFGGALQGGLSGLQMAQSVGGFGQKKTPGSDNVDLNQKYGQGAATGIVQDDPYKKPINTFFGK